MIGLKFKQVIITINLNLDTLPWEQMKIVKSLLLPQWLL